jgi:hypothetical protein
MLYETIGVCIGNGDLACLKYIVQCGIHPSELTLPTFCEMATVHGKLNCLKFLHESGFYWDAMTCVLAAANGHLDCLAYSHTNGCCASSSNERIPWDVLAIMHAFANKHIDCISYLHAHGPSMSNPTWQEYMRVNALNYESQ